MKDDGVLDQYGSNDNGKVADSGNILEVKSIGFPDGSVVSSDEERQHEITI